MKKSYRTLVTALFFGAYILGACSGALPAQNDSPQESGGSSQSSEAVFTGTVESMGGGHWLISGQQVNVDGSTSVDTNIQVGDVVKVEAIVQTDGSIAASKIESMSYDGSNANTNDDGTNTNDNSNAGNDNDDDSSNSNSNSNSNDDDEQEVYGVVEAMTDDSITIDGVTFVLAGFTEFNDVIAVGDTVKIHVIVGDDGTLTIREIEKATSIGDENGNFNGDDDDNGNSNGNSNDDDDDDNSNNNSNDDDGHDDDNGNSNSNDSNSNDD